MMHRHKIWNMVLIFMAIKLVALKKKGHFHCSVGACHCERKKLIPVFGCFSFTTSESILIKSVEVRAVQANLEATFRYVTLVGLCVGTHFS